MTKDHKIGQDIVKLAVQFDMIMYYLRHHQKNLMLGQDHLSAMSMEDAFKELRKARELALPSEYKDHFKFKYDNMYSPAIWTSSQIEKVKRRAQEALLHQPSK